MDDEYDEDGVDGKENGKDEDCEDDEDKDINNLTDSFDGAIITRDAAYREKQIQSNKGQKVSGGVIGTVIAPAPPFIRDMKPLFLNTFVKQSMDPLDLTPTPEVIIMHILTVSMG